MGALLNFNVNLVSDECINCGIQFAYSVDFKNRKLRDHSSFYCPNGHAQNFTSQSEADKLKAELNETKERLQRSLSRENELTGKFNKLTKRIACGVCPCCNRTFKQLGAHMKNKHPNYKGE